MTRKALFTFSFKGNLKEKAEVETKNTDGTQSND